MPQEQCHPTLVGFPNGNPSPADSGSIFVHEGNPPAGFGSPAMREAHEVSPQHRAHNSSTVCMSPAVRNLDLLSQRPEFGPRTVRVALLTQ